MSTVRENELIKQNKYLERELETYKMHYMAAIDQKETFRIHYMAAIDQRNAVQAELDKARELCVAYETSFCWKITKPIRSISGLLRKNK